PTFTRPIMLLNLKLSYQMTPLSSPATNLQNHNLLLPLMDWKNTMSKRSSTHDSVVKGGNTSYVGLAMVQNMTTGSPDPPSKIAPHSIPGLPGQTRSLAKPLASLFPKGFFYRSQCCAVGS